jgi:hypothetical protein
LNFQVHAKFLRRAQGVGKRIINPESRYCGGFQFPRFQACVLGWGRQTGFVFKTP